PMKAISMFSRKSVRNVMIVCLRKSRSARSDEPKETMMPQPERREALPNHPVPAGLGAPEAWRLRVDGLVAQPLALSLSEVDALGAHTHAADFICDEGWMVPNQQWEGVAVAAI